MDPNQPPPWPEEAPPSRYWIYLTILAICVAALASYVYRPWRKDKITYLTQQFLLENSSDHRPGYTAHKTIKLGLLQSLSGPMAISEKSMVEAERMAVDEINARGGILGRQVEVVVADGKSDPRVFASEAERLISSNRVCTIIGCYTSASRRAVNAVVTKHDHLLIYPKSFEGLELSPNIVYTGAAPNQQISPAVRWSFDNIGRRFYLVSSDDPAPPGAEPSRRTINSIVRRELRALQGEFVGEKYIPPGGTDFGAVVAAIKRRRPDVIFSSVVGDSNIAFYEALRNAGITTTVVSVSIGEDELRKLPAATMVGNYAAWSYFQSLDRPENKAFVARFKEKYGLDRVTSDVIETAYFSVLLWAQALAEAEKDDVRGIRRNLLDQSLDAPEGVVSIERETHYTWRSFSVGKIKPNGQFEVVWTARKPIRPAPFPQGRTESEWRAVQETLHRDALEDYSMPFDDEEP